MVRKVIQGAYFPTSASVGVTGTAQGVGASGATVSLVPTYHVYKIQEDAVGEVDESQANNIFTSTPFNISNPWYKYSTKLSTAGSFTARQGDTGGSSAATYTLLDNLEPGDGQHIQVKVEVYENNLSGDLLATDVVTCYALRQGSNNPHLILTNEAHVVATDSNGSGMNYTNAGGTLKAFIGATEIVNTDVTFYVGDTGTNTAKTQNQLTLTLSGSNPTNKTYALSGVSWSSDQEFFEIRAIFAAGLFDDNTARTVERGYSISKSKTGTPGQGSAGDNAKTVHLAASDYSIVYDGNGANPEPSTSTDITLTATAINFTDPYFKFTVDGDAESNYTNGEVGTTQDQKTFEVPATIAAFGTDSKVMRVGVSEAAESTTEVAYDTINIYAVKDGSDGITAILSNDSGTVAADSNGAITSYANTTTSIEVLDGGTRLDYIGASGVTAAGEYTVAPVESQTGGADDITVGDATDDNSLGVTFGVASDWRAASQIAASITFTITGKKLSGESFTLTKKMGITQSKQGTTGDNAKTIRVNPSQHFVRLVQVDRNTEYAPNLITFTGATQNTTADGAWSTSAGTVRGANGSGSVVNTHTAPTCGVLTNTSDFVDGMVVTYTLASADGSLADSYTLRAVEDGTSAIVAIVTNETHLLPASADGVISDFDGSGTQIFVYQGNVELDFETDTATRGEWNLAALTATTLDGSAATFGEGAVSAEGSTPQNALIADHTSAANATDAFTIPLTITGRNAQNEAFTINKTQTLTKAKAGATSAGVQKHVVAYRAENKNPNPSVVPVADALDAAVGYEFAKPTVTVNKRLYESQGTLNNASTAYDWAVATSGSSDDVFTFELATVIDGGPDYAGATYEVNKNDIWLKTDEDPDRKYQAQAAFSDAISDSEWKEIPADDTVVEVVIEVPEVDDYNLGSIILLGDEFYILVDIS